VKCTSILELASISGHRELKMRSKKNLVQSKSLIEMLENTIKKYHNKILTAAEVMDELIKISKEIVSSDQEAKDLELNDMSTHFILQ
jgi:type I restriction enzyme R subunit